MKTARTLLGLIILGAILLTPTAFGNLSAYVALIAALVAAPVLLDANGRNAALANPGLRAFFLAFVLITIALAVSSQTISDMGALGDFVVLLLACVVFVLFHGMGAWLTPPRVAGVALAGSALSMAISVYQVAILGDGRSTGLVSSAIFMGNVGVWLGFIAFCGIWLTSSRWRWLFLLGPVFALLASVLSGTRGSLVALAGIVLALGMAFILTQSRNRLLATLTIAGGLAAAAIGVLLVGTQLGLTTRLGYIGELFTTGETVDASITYRLQYYQAGLSAFAEAPIFGHGWWRRFSAAMPYMSEELIAQGSGASYAHLHNEMLNFATAMGVVGVLAYLLIATAPLFGLRAYFSDPRTFGLAAMGLVLSVGMLIMGLFDAMLIFEMPKAVFCFTTAIVLALAVRQRAES